MNSKLEAIAHLECSFAHNTEFKKAWTDYIEMSVIEAIEEFKPKMPDHLQLKIAKYSAAKILRLFDPDWWKGESTLRNDQKVQDTIKHAKPLNK